MPCVTAVTSPQTCSQRCADPGPPSRRICPTAPPLNPESVCRRLEDHEELGSGIGALEAWDQRLGAAARESKDGGGRDAGGLGSRQRAFWTNVCICNTLIVERGPDGEYVYQVGAEAAT